MPYDGPGRYRHWKGGEYEVLGLALQEDTVLKREGEPASGPSEITHVIYRPLTPGSLLEDREETFWARRLDDFNEMVWPEGELGVDQFEEPDVMPEIASDLLGQPVPRFKLIRRINAFYFGTL